MTSKKYETVLIERQDGITWLVMNRPEKRNAMSPQLHLEMDDPSARSEAERLVGRHLRERFPDFWKNRDMGLYELRVAGDAIGTLRGSGRKMRRVIDNRRMRGADLAGTR
jgi:hypothetical protein